MNKFFYWFCLIFVIVYVFYLLFVIFNKKKKEKIFSTNQAKLIILPNKLDTSLINKNVFAQVISISNSFIVACTFAISEFFDNYILKLFISFLVLIVLILVIYRIIGIIYKRKEGRQYV